VRSLKCGTLLGSLQGCCELCDFPAEGGAVLGDPAVYFKVGNAQRPACGFVLDRMRTCAVPHGVAAEGGAVVGDPAVCFKVRCFSAKLEMWNVVGFTA
jgi:hypothetical protein